jgi:indoleamine 2,3-dioxygenase
MGSLGTTPSSFNVLKDPKPDDTSLPAFMVSATRGFLPRTDPIVKLPSEFDVLDDILHRMPIKKADGTPGLLAESKLGETVDKELPDLTEAIEKYKDDLPLMNALYRDYSFLASAYLLEPCHKRFMKGEDYGLAREKLPRAIALPIVKVAERYVVGLIFSCRFTLTTIQHSAGFKPFMEYAGSYALFNYMLVDPKLGLEYSNLRLIRAFEHGLDPTSSEAGFVLIHIAMVRNSGYLVSGALQALEGCAESDREAFNDGLNQVVEALKNVNHVMNGT